jgi:exopolysaccharide biosynthesis predicted pyruvyltransferase EpsI
MKHDQVIKKLTEIQNNLVYFEQLGGNNGDNLIEMGALEVFSRLNIKLVSDPESAEVIVINGSGDLSYHPASKPIEETRQAKHFIKFPDKLVILLPSSSTPVNADRIAGIIKKRTAQTIIFARDAKSHKLFQAFEAPSVEVYLDHDMAIGLIGSKWLNDLTLQKRADNLLIVERFDAEGATTPPMIYRTPSILRSLIPRAIKNFVKKKALTSVHKNTPFINEAVKKHFPNVEYQTLIAADISLPQNHTFEEFSLSVARASVVVSTRLHVCILAAMLGKPFVAVQFEGGSKLSGVFESTLEDLPNAKLWIRKKEQV